MQRITDVANPWLDAGIVSFSTLGYRTDRESWRDWYPGALDQRVVPRPIPQLVLQPAGDGHGAGEQPAVQGMLRLRYPDRRRRTRDAQELGATPSSSTRPPTAWGVDVMRWLYCAHKPENNLPFGYQRADEVRRQFLIPLWNMYSFFVTYANLDGWEPGREGFEPGASRGSDATQ